MKKKLCNFLFFFFTG